MEKEYNLKELQLSIIVPVYKVEPYLRACLDSISASPLDCWEALLIDDGSPDSCPQICDEFAAKDSRFRVIHQQNAGVAVARNAGLDAVQGEWIWFVDSDDMVDMSPVGAMMEWLKANEKETAKLYKNKDKNKNHNQNETLRYETEQSSYENQTAELYENKDKNKNETAELDENQNQNKEVRVKFNVSVDKDKKVNVPVDVPVYKRFDLVMFGLEDFNDGEEINISDNNDKSIVEDECQTKNLFLLQHNCYHHPRLWYKRKVVDKYGLRFTKGVKTGEDGEFMYKYMMLCKRPVKFGNTLYYYRQRAGSATNNVNTYRQHIQDKIVIFDRILSFMKEHQIQQETWIEVRLQESMRNLLYAVFKTKQCHSNLIQKEVRDIMRNYSQSGYVMFNTFPHRIAFLSLVLYCFLLKYKLLIKCLK